MKESFDTCISVTALRHRCDVKAKKNLATRESPLFSITLMELLFCWAHFRDNFLLSVEIPSKYNIRRCRLCQTFWPKWLPIILFFVNSNKFFMNLIRNSGHECVLFYILLLTFCVFSIVIPLFICHIIYDACNKYSVRRRLNHSFRKSRQRNICGSNLQVGERNNDLNRVEAKV